MVERVAAAGVGINSTGDVCYGPHCVLQCGRPAEGVASPPLRTIAVISTTARRTQLEH
jgi:hypothetical protein